MPEKHDLLLITPPGKVRSAARWGLPMAYLAYRIGSGPHLYRTTIPSAIPNGVLALDAEGFRGEGSVETLCGEILRECSGRGFRGILCLWGPQPPAILHHTVRRLSELTAGKGWPIYVPECCAGDAERTLVLISSAVSGGTLHQRLRDAAEQYGISRLVLHAERAAEDFSLPSPDGSGAALSREELQTLLRQLKPTVFFSQELCAHYFTYMSKESGAHFVLFDSAGSLRNKLQLAEAMGIRRAVLDYRQTDDLLPDLLTSLSPVPG